MASGSFTGSTSNNYITPRITWTSTPNEAANTSNITVNFQLKKSSSSSQTTYGTGAWTIEINGQLYDFSKYISLSPNDTYTTVYTKTVNNIQHNNDGTKSFRVSLTGGIAGTSYTTTSIAQVISLDNIPRASTVTSFKFTNGYINQGIDITISSKVSSYYHDIHLYLPDTSGTGVVLISSSIGGRKTGGTHHIALTEAQIQTFYAKMPTETSAKFTVYVRTYSNSTSTTAIGDWQTASTTGYIHGDVKPKFDDTNPFIAAINTGGLGGLYVQGKSTAKLTASVQPGDGSSIESYTFSGPSVSSTTTASSVTTGIIYSSGTLTYKVTVQDKRKRKAEKTLTIYVYPYSTPSISSASIQRCTSDGILSSSGTYAKYNINSAYSAVNGKNTRTVTIAYSSDGGNTYLSETIIQGATDTNNSASGTYGSDSFSTTSSYQIRFTIKDDYGATATKTISLSTAERAVNIRSDGKGIGFGKISENQYSIETPWDIHFADTESQMLLFKNGSKSSWEASLYKGGSSDTAVVGLWDRTNQKPVWQYKDDGRFYIQNKIALTEGERSGNARLLTNVYSKCFSSNQTGYIAIRLGTATLSLTSMITIKGHVTSYQNSTSFEASCYFYNAEGKFHGTVATMSNPDVLREVYFAEGNPSGYVYLIIGASNASWNYPTVVIDSLSVGWANVDSTAYESGWTASVYTDLSSNFTNVTACSRGGMYKTLWTGAVQSGSITLNENFRNFKFLTCVLGDSASPWGITLGAFWDIELSELHFGAVFVDNDGYAGGNLYGAKFVVNSTTSLSLTKCGTKNGPGAYLRKIVGWR